MFKIVNTQDEMLKAYSIRAIVFVEEQDCPYDIEVDGKDFSALHVLGEIDNEPFATGRMRFIGEWVKLERLAIRKAYRNKGYGNRLIEFMIKTARDSGYTKIKLHAQTRALDFYLKHGFKPKGDIFLEADINHQLMTLEIK